MEDKRCINPVEKIQKTCKLKDHEIEEKKLKTKDKLNNINNFAQSQQLEIKLT